MSRVRRGKAREEARALGGLNGDREVAGPANYHVSQSCVERRAAVRFRSAVHFEENLKDDRASSTATKNQYQTRLSELLCREEEPGRGSKTRKETG